jgi:diguanylate cyclase (GGDEF)-like protein
LSAPLVDVRGWYVVSPLFGVDGALGVLYADGHRSAALPREREVDAVRALTAIAAVALDNAALFARTQALAVRDPLTGLFNRRALSERLAAEIAASDRERRTFGYVMVDVDDFKRVNDRRGHAAGDAVLRLVADTLVRGSRAGDIVARYAGDEFVILLSNIDPELARALVSRLSAELRRQGLRCSIGAALYPRDAAGAEELAAAADRALYATKATGKDGFSFA